MYSDREIGGRLDDSIDSPLLGRDDNLHVPILAIIDLASLPTKPFSTDCDEAMAAVQGGIIPFVVPR